MACIVTVPWWNVHRFILLWSTPIQWARMTNIRIHTSTHRTRLLHFMDKFGYTHPLLLPLWWHPILGLLTRDNFGNISIRHRATRRIAEICRIPQFQVSGVFDTGSKFYCPRQQLCPVLSLSPLPLICCCLVHCSPSITVRILRE